MSLLQGLLPLILWFGGLFAVGAVIRLCMRWARNMGDRVEEKVPAEKEVPKDFQCCWCNKRRPFNQIHKSSNGEWIVCKRCGKGIPSLPGKEDV